MFVTGVGLSPVAAPRIQQTPVPATPWGFGRDGSTAPTPPKEHRAPMEISEYLDHEPERAATRIRDLEALADDVAHRPLGEFLADLRAVLEVRALSGSDHQRLHILLSQHYHASAEVDQHLHDQLRDEVNTAWEHRIPAHLTEDRRE